MALIINEELENRDQTIKHIENMKGVKINRIRKNQISIKSDLFDDDKPIVLKGDIYEEGRDYSDYRKEFNPKPTRDPEFVREKLTELKRTFAERIEKREIRNRSKFKNHRSKIYQKIDKVFKEKIKILDINILTAILSMLVITMVFQVCIFALIIWRL